MWALYPDTIYWAVRWIWETSLSAFLLSLLFMLTVEMEGDERLSSWIGYGLLWGIEALTNTAALSFLPFAGCWLAYQLHRRGKQYLAPALISAVVFWMAIMPWLIRDYRVMGHFVLVRDNAGNELRLGNNPLSEGQYVLALHPSQNALVLAKYKRMGEYRLLRRPRPIGERVDRTASGEIRPDYTAPRDGFSGTAYLDWQQINL